MSVDDLAARDGSRCNICGRKIDMRLSGRAKWGPTIDHLVPVIAGGTNHPSNLALAHRHCNMSRHASGPAQLLLAS
jgi:5-methylcytosine-specific restriction endonuclease McrA